MQFLKQVAFTIPILGWALRDRERAIRELQDLRKCIGYEPGTYASLYPNQDDIRARLNRLKKTSLADCPGVDVALDRQLQWLRKMAEYYPTQPFPEEQREGCHHYLKNDFFAHADSIFLHGMIRALQPRRIVEIGAGYSTAVMVTTNDDFFDRKIELTSIEPHPERLRRLLSDDDLRRMTFIRQSLQDVTEAPWKQLQANDILFTDSSHVLKCGSDVQTLFHDILPGLQPGVVIHLHDIGAQFEYPADWLNAGTACNEAYLLHSFLQFNNAFEILLWGPVAIEAFRDEVAKTMPLCLAHPGGSFWMRKTA